MQQSLIQPTDKLRIINFKELWQFRELLWFLTWRNITVRYRQTVLGVGWAVLQPIISMIVFSLIFGELAKIDSDGIPYAIFSYTALLPWRYFSTAATMGISSFVGNQELIGKTYFPRLIFPLISVITPLMDFAISFVVLLVMMPFFQVPFSINLIFVPIFLALVMLTALALSLWLATFNVYFRDVGYMLAFGLQVWMYLSPVVYPTSLVPVELRAIYALNPITGAIDGMRWAVLGTPPPDPLLLLISLGMLSLLLVSGLIYFNRTERTIVDVI